MEWQDYAKFFGKMKHLCGNKENEKNYKSVTHKILMMKGERKRERDREKIQMFDLVSILKSTFFSSSLSLKW